MPDRIENSLAPLDRAPTHEGVGYHEFVESEFAPGSGRCDKCGGGPAADIHQKPLDHMARVADALEEIKGAHKLAYAQLLPAAQRIAFALEQIAMAISPKLRYASYGCERCNAAFGRFSCDGQPFAASVPCETSVRHGSENIATSGCTSVT